MEKKMLEAGTVRKLKIIKIVEFGVYLAEEEKEKEKEKKEGGGPEAG